MPDDNKAILRRLYDEAFSQGDLSVIDDVYAEDVEVHIPGLPEDPYGPASIKALVGLIRSAFPGITVTLEDMVAEHDKVAAHVTWRHANVGKAQGVSPREPMAGWPRIDIYRLFNGKIIEQWGDRNDLDALHRLGIA